VGINPLLADRVLPPPTPEGGPMRAMAFVWSVIIIGGIAYFSIIGLTHH
jgi:hypothetical protein